MLRILVVVALAFAVSPNAAAAQLRDAPERGVYATVFRSPATGMEVRSGRAAAFAGLYPTVISRAGQRSTVSFIRTGVTYYLKPYGTTAYVSPSLVWSLDEAWASGALTEIGVRARIRGRVHGRLGAALLTTFERDVRVNPTIGFDVKLGRLPGGTK